MGEVGGDSTYPGVHFLLKNCQKGKRREGKIEKMREKKEGGDTWHMVKGKGKGGVRLIWV